MCDDCIHFGSCRWYWNDDTPDRLRDCSARETAHERPLVVRCVDCANAHKEPFPDCIYCCLHDISMRENDYCSYGERKRK